jgi:hypothetical protein
MNSILLAIVLIGGPQPEHRLILGCDPATPQGKRLIADVKHDAWLNSQFVVSFEDKPWFAPKWKSSRMGQWSEWPSRDDAPRGPFVTAGMSTIWLRPQLERHIEEMRGPQDYSADDWQYPWCGLIYRKRVDAPGPVPVPDPAHEEN